MLDLKAFAESMLRQGLMQHGLSNSFSEERSWEERRAALRALQGLALLGLTPTFDANVLRQLHESIAAIDYPSMALARQAVIVQNILKTNTYEPVRISDDTMAHAAILISFAGDLLGKMYHHVLVTPSELSAALTLSRFVDIVPDEGISHAGLVLKRRLLHMIEEGTLDAITAQTLLTGIVTSGQNWTTSERTMVSRAVLNAFQAQFKKLGDMRTAPNALLDVLGADNLIRDPKQFQSLAQNQAAQKMETLDPTLLGCKMPSNLLYHRGHSWVRPDKDDSVRIGLDDIVAHLIGKVDAIKMPKPGETVRQGKPVLRLIRNDETVEVCSPMDGEVAIVNQAVIDTPRILAAEPYEDGWLMTIRPTLTEDALYDLKFGDNAHQWQKNEVTRLQAMFQDEIATAADGATLAHDALAGIPGVRWSEVLNKFLNQ
ncbi:MAG: glycine cleavage system protein H [Deltaproteobacteria bacterium]|nr:glycine cleavage system protein H [Deltaproteobacteria bacterium]